MGRHSKDYGSYSLRAQGEHLDVTQVCLLVHPLSTHLGQTIVINPLILISHTPAPHLIHRCGPQNVGSLMGGYLIISGGV